MMDNRTTNNVGQFYWWFGVVEDRDDPLRIGRCRVRIMGYHIDSTELLPTEDLPWAVPIMPANNPSISGVGGSANGVVTGTWVVGFFADGSDGQHPMFFGTVGAVPGGPAGDPCAPAGGNSASDPAGAPGGAQDIQVSGSAKGMAQKIFQTAKSLGYDDYMSIAFVALAEKECGLKPKAEQMGYSAARIRQVWPKRADQAVKYANNPQGLANFIYATVNGNKGGTDGWNYRGKGLNQLTGRANYAAIKQIIGVDIIANPDLLITDQDVAVKAFFAFYQYRGLGGGVVRGRKTARSQSEANKIITDATGGRDNFSTGSAFGRENFAKVDKFSKKYTPAMLSAKA
jgi:predicted chitinase